VKLEQKWENSPERESLLAYCNKVIYPKLANLETQRLAMKRKRYVRIAIYTAISVLAVFIIAMLIDKYSFVPQALFVIIGGSILAGSSRVGLYKLAKSAKADIVPDILSQLGWNYAATFKKSTDFYHLNRHGVFPKWDTKRYEDKITGKIAGVPFTAFEIHMSYGGGDSEVNHNFLMIKAPTAKSFSGMTVVKTKHSILNLEQRTVKDLRRVKFVSSKFENLFDVFSNDNVEAQYLLPPNDVEIITTFKEELEGIKPDSFQDGLYELAEELSQIFTSAAFHNARIRFQSLTFMDAHLFIILGTNDFFELRNIENDFNNPQDIHKILTEIDLIHRLFERFKPLIKSA